MSWNHTTELPGGAVPKSGRLEESSAGCTPVGCCAQFEIFQPGLCRVGISWRPGATPSAVIRNEGLRKGEEAEVLAKSNRSLPPGKAIDEAHVAASR